MKRFTRTFIHQRVIGSSRYRDTHWPLLRTTTCGKSNQQETLIDYSSVRNYNTSLLLLSSSSTCSSTNIISSNSSPNEHQHKSTRSSNSSSTTGSSSTIVKNSTIGVQEQVAVAEQLESNLGKKNKKMSQSCVTGKKLNEIRVPVPSDIEVSQHCKPEFIGEIATRYGIDVDEELEFYGKYKAKIDGKKILKRLGDAPQGNYILITGINPTPLGEGKSTTCLGISQALGAHLGKKVVSCLRQPSQGPVFVSLLCLIMMNNGFYCNRVLKEVLLEVVIHKSYVLKEIINI